MDPEFWLNRWKRNEIGFHKDEINTHLGDYWPRLDLPPGAAVFVPLCGKTLDMLWLRGQGHEVLGVEISPVAVADFFKDNDLQPTVSEHGPFDRWEADQLVVLRGDFFRLSPEDLSRVQGVYDRASLVALPPEMRPRYITHLEEILPPSAEILLVTLEYPQAQMQGPPFSVSPTEVHRLYSARYRIMPLFKRDVLEENPRFRARGLSQLHEKVFHLIPQG